MQNCFSKIHKPRKQGQRRASEPHRKEGLSRVRTGVADPQLGGDSSQENGNMMSAGQNRLLLSGMAGPPRTPKNYFWAFPCCSSVNIVSVVCKCLLHNVFRCSGNIVVRQFGAPEPRNTTSTPESAGPFSLEANAKHRTSYRDTNELLSRLHRPLLVGSGPRGTPGEISPGVIPSGAWWMVEGMHPENQVNKVNF